jgi:anti-sigma factor RsiW
MHCDLNATTLAAYLDNELPVDEIGGVQKHISECPQCAAEVAEIVSLKRSLRATRNHFQPSAEFRRRMQQQISKPKQNRWMTRFLPLMAAAVVLLLVAIGWVQHSRNSDSFSELADLHVSALASANPVDVVSTDRHTVKPWFEGRIPFSFNLPELAGTEFTLLGGRQVYLHQAPGAQLIFTAGKHKVSVLIFQESSEAARMLPMGDSAGRHNSFNVETWSAPGLRFLVISDAELREVQKLAQIIKAVND